MGIRRMHEKESKTFVYLPDGYGGAGPLIGERRPISEEIPDTRC